MREAVCDNLMITSLVLLFSDKRSQEKQRRQDQQSNMFGDNFDWPMPNSVGGDESLFPLPQRVGTLVYTLT